MGWATTKMHWEERSARLRVPPGPWSAACPSIAPAAPSAQQVEVRFPVPWLPIVRERLQKLARTKNLNALQGGDCTGRKYRPRLPRSLPSSVIWRKQSGVCTVPNGKSQLSRSFLPPLSLGISIPYLFTASFFGCHNRSAFLQAKMPMPVTTQRQVIR